MQHDATQPEYLTTAQAAEHPLAGVAPSTVWRWCVRGVPTPAGLITLRHIRAGRSIKTRADWLEQFTERLAAAHTDNPAPSMPTDGDLADVRYLQESGL